MRAVRQHIKIVLASERVSSLFSKALNAQLLFLLDALTSIIIDRVVNKTSLDCLLRLRLMIDRFGAILVFALSPVDRETVDTRFAYKLSIFALHARLVESHGSTAAGALILFIGIALVG